MEDRVQISLLMDLYGPLLTEKQREVMEIVMEFYYNDDLSLSEIAELNNTSRQATYDLIKRCCKLLRTYEDKLNLLQKSMNRKKKIASLLMDFEKKYSLNEEELNNLKKQLEDLQ